MGRLTTGAKEGRARDMATAAAFLVLGIAMLDPIYGGITMAARLLRWAGRVAVLLLFTSSALADGRARERAQPISAV